MLGYPRFIVRPGTDRRAAGGSPLEMAQGTDLGQYAEWADQERIVGNLHRAYADLAGAAEAMGGPINFSAALSDTSWRTRLALVAIGRAGLARIVDDIN